MITPTLRAEDFTQADRAALQEAMSGLVAACSALSNKHATGTWEPASTDILGHFAESAMAIEEIARALACTRRDIRKVHSVGRQRLYERASARHPSDLVQPPRG